MHQQEIHYLTFDLEARSHFTQYSLHHVIYASTKLKVAMSNHLTEDQIPRNMRDGQTDVQTD